MSLTEQKGGPIGRPSIKSHYEEDFIRKVVQEVELGLSVRRASIQYELHRSTLENWLKRYGSATYLKNKRVSFTPAFRRTVVRAVETGKMSIKEACLAYNVKTPITIETWIKDCKRENDELTASNTDLLKKQEVKKEADPTTLAEVKNLQKQLAEAQLKIAALNTLIDVAEEQLKINIRKKPGARQS